MHLALATDTWAVVGSLAGVIGIVVAVGLFWMQLRRQRKSLAYEVSDRALVRVGPEARGKVQIRYEGAEVTDVHLLQVILRNTGSVPILREDFDRPVTLSFPTSTKLLPSTLTAVGAPDDIRPTATLSEAVITVGPTLLNPGDRITIGILASGLTAADREIDVDVRIAGVREAVRTIDGPTDARITGGYAVLAVMISGIIAAGGAYVVGQSQRDASNSLVIRLTEPASTTIPVKNRLRGTVSELRAGEAVWTFVANVKDQTAIYPVPGPCPVKDGRWTCNDAIVGDPPDKGKYIVWAAVVTDVQAAIAARAIRDRGYIDVGAAKEPPHVASAVDRKIFMRR